jgi:CheY-like chemotaxis protein
MTADGSVLDTADVLLVGEADWLDAFVGTLRDRTTGTVHREPGVDAALAAAHSGPTDCIVTDHSLPDGVGLDLLEGLPVEPRTVPVVVADCDRGRGDGECGARHGCERSHYHRCRRDIRRA